MASSAEDEAKKRMLARLGEGTTWRDGNRVPQSEEAAKSFAQQESAEARKRMLAMMGGSSDKLKRGLGAAFGFGGEDDETYGYKPRRREPMQEIDVVTGKPINGPIDPDEAFANRIQEWSRKPAIVDPNPPPMPNTLRAPGQAPTPGQVEEAAREEDGLLEALKSAVDESGQ